VVLYGSVLLYISVKLKACVVVIFSDELSASDEEPKIEDDCATVVDPTALEDCASVVLYFSDELYASLVLIISDELSASDVDLKIDDDSASDVERMTVVD
jgi:hypothetical protein